MPEASQMNEAHKALFLELTLMLSASAMQQIGKTINPLTGKTEVNLDAAQATIDLIEMLEAKTRGNLDKDETRLLANTLTSLRMNYVETASSQAAPASEGAHKAGAAAESGPAQPSSPEDTTAKEPKFRKTYT